MATDTLVLGGLSFDNWSTPSHLPYGGKQAMAVHKLPGGQRVVDTLGPDDDEIVFEGTLWNAYSVGQMLNAMRIAGQVVPLSFGGQFYAVIVQEAIVRIIRFPNYGTYTVKCLIISNPMAGILTAAISSLSSLVGADMASVMSLVGL